MQGMHSYPIGLRVPLRALAVNAWPRPELASFGCFVSRKTACDHLRDSLLPKRTKCLLQFRRTVNTFFACFGKNNFRGSAIDSKWVGRGLLSRQKNQAANAEAANLLARTRLKAPINVGSFPRVDGSIRAEGRPRRTLCSMVCFSASSTSDQALAISPPTTTASGLQPTTRLD